MVRIFWKGTKLMNQLRRDPITGIWAIMLQNGKDMVTLKPDGHRRLRRVRPGETCEFCAGHESETPLEIFAIRPGNSPRNEPGWRVRVVPERFPVLQIHGETNNRGVGIYDMLDGIGAHELVVETPEHGKIMTDLAENEIADVLTAYRERVLDLKRDPRFRYILVYKNVGEGRRGPSLRHSLSHVIATPITPMRARDELSNAQEYFLLKERCIFCDMIRQELETPQRLVAENENFIALCPFASRAPFEIWILPKRHETFYEWNNELPALAKLLKTVLLKIRRALGDPNYVMVVHSGPNLLAGRQRGYWKTVERDFHWHLEITPRLRGTADFDIIAGFQVNWLPPERAAEVLRQCMI
jgi:UDPglucose--hexose-1-phosphate uridylyltransferase